MNKDLYEILGVDKNATAEQIKKAYRKSALKWHPDRWVSKSIEERQKANEKMREINKAYDILGIEQLRKRYDSGEINPTDFDFAAERVTANLRAELDRIREIIERLEEEKRVWNEILRDVRIWIEEGIDFWHQNKEYDKSMARWEAIREINDEAQIYGEDWEGIDNNLWEPYETWREKVEKIEIKSSPRGEEGIYTSELDEFKKKVIDLIKKRKRGEKKEKIGGRWVKEAGRCQIENLERLMTEKAIKPEELGKYTNYQEQINNLNKIWKIQSLAEEITNYIWDEIINKRNRNPKPKNPPRPKPQPVTKKYDNWTKEQLIKAIQEKEVDNNSLQELVSKLKEEIQKLRAETEQTPEIQQEISQRETQLQQVQMTLDNIVNNNCNNDGSPLPIIPFISVISIFVLLVGLIAYQVKKNKVKK